MDKNPNTEEWHREGSLLYTLEQEGWHRGQPVLRNRLMVKIERGPGATDEEADTLTSKLRAFLSAEQAHAAKESPTLQANSEWRACLERQHRRLSAVATHPDCPPGERLQYTADALTMKAILAALSSAPTLQDEAWKRLEKRASEIEQHAAKYPSWNITEAVQHAKDLRQALATLSRGSQS